MFVRTYHLVAREGALAEVEEEAHEHGQRHLPEERAEEEDGAADEPVDGQPCCSLGVVFGGVWVTCGEGLSCRPCHAGRVCAPVRRFSVMDSITTSPSSVVLKRARARTWFRLRV